ncbi:DUF4350 domain-containing protein [Gemmatirosa kalamazoonensis]|uniref:DUF4350 domain-containing protein n=1 Tax=Gemmatirosa kalamazoonensis TaxID=861299 RepID=UPI00046D743C|nr:DUF4350 domain-containing protein [Gemmatirosa kalamazoonensis]
MADRVLGGVLTPRVVGGVFVLLLVAALLVSPEEGRTGDARLSSRSAAPQGARALAETLQRVGWRVERRDAAYAGQLAEPPQPRVVHAVLDPRTPLRASEVGVLLDAVRRGAGLLVVVTNHTPLADSLGYSASVNAGTLAPEREDTVRCPAGPWGAGGAITWADGMVHTLYLLSRRPEPGAVRFARAETQFLRGGRRGAFDAARGFPLGRGRVVAIADPDLLRNDVLRVCRWGAGVAAVRMAEWLAVAGGERRIVFDEYHQSGAGEPHPLRVVRRALASTPGGRATLQLALAALVLLAAAGARALPPAPRARTARRSPLEHVDALARAYAHVGATRVVARRLARGIRRRHGRGVWRAGDPHGDAAFLRTVASRRPAVADDVERLLAATEHADADPAALATAAARVDRALTPRTPPT